MMMVTTTLVVASLTEATTMPASISDPQPAPPAPAPPPVDLFFEQVTHAVRRTEARARQAEQLTSLPYCYTISDTAGFTGLPVWRLRRLCRDCEIDALKFSGYWLVRRDEFIRLLDPLSTLQWRTSTARQQIFLDRLRDLAAMLRPGEVESTISVLLKDLRRAVDLDQTGADYDDTAGFVWHRAKLRVQDGMINPEQTEEALRLVRTIIEVGMNLGLRNGTPS